MNEKENNLPKPVGITEQEMVFIDNYFANGFNKVKASMAVKPGSSYNTADKWAERAFQKKEVINYYNAKVAALREQLHVDNVMVLKELMQFAYSDATVYMGLSEEEIKELPPDVRRCIASVDTTTKTWIGKDKELVREVTVKVKLIDKIKAIDMISKHIDFYNADNKSKAGIIDLTKADNNQLNAVLSLIESQKKSS